MSSRDLDFFAALASSLAPLALLIFVCLESFGPQRYFRWVPLKAPGDFSAVRIRWKVLAESPK